MKSKNILLPLLATALICCKAPEAAAQIPAPASEKTFAALIGEAAYLAGGTERYTPFGDGDFRIIRVTNLDKEGEGSLAWAIRQKGPRIVVFETGGVIDLEGATLKLQEPYLYIAGQTAPAPGITLIKGEVSIQSHDILIRHISVRPGDRDMMKGSGWEADGMSTWKAWNVVVDHCSLTWATDELLSASGPRHEGRDKTSHDITFSNNIIAECLSNSSHSKGEHSKGTLIHDYCSRIAVVGNLYASNLERNPLLKPNARAYIANNVIYNPKRRAIHASWPEDEYREYPDSLRPAKIAAVGNVLIPGPDTPSDFWMIFGKIEAYHQDNMITPNAGDTKGERKRRIVNNQGTVLAENPVSAPVYRAIPSAETAAAVLANAGARPAQRAAIDRRLTDETKAGTGRVIDSQDDTEGYPSCQPVRRPLDIPDSGIEEWLEKLAAALLNP